MALQKNSMLAMFVLALQLSAATSHAMQLLEAITQLDSLIEQLHSLHVNEQQTEALSDQEIKQYLYEFTERKSAQLGWTESWRWWRKVFHICDLRQIMRDYVFDVHEKDKSLQWTHEGRYCYVIENMRPAWRARVAVPEVLRHVTGDFLSKHLLTNEPAALLLLAQRAQQEPDFKKELFDRIELSKTQTDSQTITAAANAATILNAAGYYLHGNMRGIRIPGADLSHGCMDHTDFTNADLRGVNVASASLSSCILRGAQVEGLRFGQLLLQRYSSWITSVGFSPDGTRVVSGGEDGALWLWDIASGVRLRGFAGHAGPVESVGFSPDGKRIVSGGDSTVLLWDVESGVELKRFTDHTSYVNSVVFSPDGGRIVSGSEDGTLRLWNVESSVEPIRFEGHTNSVRSVGFSPDGKHIVSGSEDGTLRLWDAASGVELERFEGHTDSVKSVAFSPDGKHVASASKDKTVRLWNVENGKNNTTRLRVLHVFGQPALSLSKADFRKSIGLSLLQQRFVQQQGGIWRDADEWGWGFGCLMKGYARQFWPTKQRLISDILSCLQSYHGSGAQVEKKWREGREMIRQDHGNDSQHEDNKNKVWFSYLSESDED